MIYSNAGAVYRGDVTAAVMETDDWEKGLVADLVFPTVNAPLPEGQYPKFQKQQGQLLKRDAKQRAPGAGYARGDLAYVYDFYLALEYGIEYPVDDVIAKKMARYFDAEVVAGRLAKRKVLLDQEIRVANTVISTLVFDTLTPTISYTSTNLATFDAAADVDASRDLLISRGETPDTAVIPYQVWTRIKASTKFQQRARGYGYGNDAILNMTPDIAAEVLNLRQVLIPRVAYDAAGEGLAFSTANIWSNSYLWLGKSTQVSNLAGMLMGGAGYQINWSEFGPEMGIESYRDEPHRSNIIRCAQYQAEKVVNSAAGTLISTQYV